MFTGCVGTPLTIQPGIFIYMESIECRVYLLIGLPTNWLAVIITENVMRRTAVKTLWILNIALSVTMSWKVGSVNWKAGKLFKYIPAILGSLSILRVTCT